MRRPLHQAGTEKSYGLRLVVGFHQHVCIRVVASRRHHVMLRAKGVSKINPLVPMSSNDQSG